MSALITSGPRVRTVAAAIVAVAVLAGTAACGGGPTPSSNPASAAPGASWAASAPAAPGAPAAPVSPADGPVTVDQPSGVSVQLGGPAEAKTSAVPGSKAAVRAYTVDLRNAQLQQRLNVTDLAHPVTDAAAFTYQIAKGIPAQVKVTSDDPVTVNGHPGADFRFDIDNLGGHKAVMFGRAVYTATRSVQQLTLIMDPAAADVAEAQRLHTQTVDTLKVP